MSDDVQEKKEGTSRRTFLTRGATAALSMGAVFGLASRSRADEIGPVTGSYRKIMARKMRMDMAEMSYNRPLLVHETNNEEDEYPTHFANFSKSLPHNNLGEVVPSAYSKLIDALWSGDEQDFANIPMGGTYKLTSPQAGLAYDLEGPDTRAVTIRPAPRMDSTERSSEYVELMGAALMRDIHFEAYDTSSLAATICDSLSSMSNFKGPKESGRVTPQTLFRGNPKGCTYGPYLSQFMCLPIPYGSQTIEQKQKTTAPRVDYLASFNGWLLAQNGRYYATPKYDTVRRYIRNSRDLAQWVHEDALYQAYLSALFIMLGMGVPVDQGNPYKNSANQMGFATFGPPHIQTLVTEVATRAVKAAWFQKWFVHRNLRPEEFGGRVDNHLSGRKQYPLHNEVLNSEVLQIVKSSYGSYLLPQAFPEGCPCHPSYAAGHATVAGACVTILKAWFDESFVIPNPVIPSADGLSLIPYRGGDANKLTVGHELNKLAANVAIGRNMAGVHWRSDYSESTKLGEAVAIGLLEELKALCNETHSFTITKFDGQTVTI